MKEGDSEDKSKIQDKNLDLNDAFIFQDKQDQIINDKKKLNDLQNSEQFKNEQQQTNVKENINLDKNSIVQNENLNNGKNIPKIHEQIIKEKPQHYVPKGIMKNFEHFEFKFEMKARHIIWISVGVYLIYQRLDQSQSYHNLKKKIYSKSIKSINHNLSQQQQQSKDQQQETNQISQNSLNSNNKKEYFRLKNQTGFPDVQGTGMYTQYLNEKDFRELQQKGTQYEKQINNFNFMTPLYILSGLQFPIFTALCGFFYSRQYNYLNNKLPQIINECNNNNQKIVLYQKAGANKQQQNSNGDNEDGNDETIQTLQKNTDYQNLKDSLSYFQFSRYYIYSQSDSIYLLSASAITAGLRFITTQL